MADYYVNSAASSVWVASQAVALGVRKVPSRAYATAAAKRFTYEVTTAGMTAATEPTWNATLGGTTADGTAVYTCREASTRVNASCHIDYVQNNVPAGDNTIYVDPAHNETIAAENVVYSPATNTPATPFKVICASDAATPPTAVATTAVVNITGSGSAHFTQSQYVYGITYNLGSAASTNSLGAFTSGTDYNLIFDNCNINLANTSTSSAFALGPATAKFCDIQFLSSKLKFGVAAQKILVNGKLVVKGGSIDAAGIIPDALIVSSYDSPGYIEYNGVDLASGGDWTSKALVNVASPQKLMVVFNDCKKAAAAAITTGTYTGPNGSRVRFINSSTDTAQLSYFDESYMGKIVDEKVIVRTGGGTQGTVPTSYKMTSTNASWAYPLEFVFNVTNEATGVAQTWLVEILHDSVTALTNGQIALEVMGRDVTTTPLVSLLRDRKASILSAAANQATSTAAWTTTGLTNPNKQSLSVTFTPLVKGNVAVRVLLYMPSKTVYVCHKAIVT